MSTVIETVREVVGGRRTRAVHWPAGLLAFTVLASYTSATAPHMRTSAFAVAELLLAVADLGVCVGLAALAAHFRLRRQLRNVAQLPVRARSTWRDDR